MLVFSCCSRHYMEWFQYRILISWHGQFHLVFSIPSPSRWWFQIFFMFILTWGNDPIWQADFSVGLKAPSSYVFNVFWITCTSWISHMSHLRKKKKKIQNLGVFPKNLLSQWKNHRHFFLAKGTSTPPEKKKKQRLEHEKSFLRRKVIFQLFILFGSSHWFFGKNSIIRSKDHPLGVGPPRIFRGIFHRISTGRGVTESTSRCIVCSGSTTRTLTGIVPWWCRVSPIF